MTNHEQSKYWWWAALHHPNPLSPGAEVCFVLPTMLAHSNQNSTGLGLSKSLTMDVSSRGFGSSAHLDSSPPATPSSPTM